MRATRPIAGVAVAAILGGLGVAAATSASAQDWGSQIPGNVYFLKDTPAGLAAAVPADQVTSGTYAGQPFKEVATDVAAPTGTKLTQVYARLKTAADSSLWQETALDDGELFDSTRVDASGHAFNANPDGFGNFKLSAIQQWAATSSDRLLPVTLVFFDALQHPLGHVDTVVKIDLNSTNAGTWTQQNPTLITGGGTQAPTATTTTLSYAAVGANLTLTATVAPTAAAGTVTFAEGSTTLGTATVANGTASYTVTSPTTGAHSYTASFAPTDTKAYAASTATLNVTVTKAADGTITVTLTVPGAPLGDPGTVTLAVPSAATVSLAGARDPSNSRVTASGALPAITVTDTHRDDLLTAWQVNVQATDFTGSAGTIGAKYLGLTPAKPTTTGTGVLTVVQTGSTVASYLDDAASKGLSQAQVLGQVATKGRGVTTLGGTLNLAVDPSAAAGTYTSVVTVTLVNG